MQSNHRPQQLTVKDSKIISKQTVTTNTNSALTKEPHKHVLLYSTLPLYSTDIFTKPNLSTFNNFTNEIKGFSRTRGSFWGLSRPWKWKKIHNFGDLGTPSNYIK